MSAASENPDLSGLSIYERAEKYSHWLKSLPLRDRVAHSLMQEEYTCPSQKHYEALVRLATRENAISAWTKLHSMPAKRDGCSFDSVVSYVGREAALCFLSPASKRTASEIKSAGVKAAKLAIELAKLIEGHSTLQFFGMRIAPPDMKDAPTLPYSEYGHEGMVFRLRAFADLASKSATSTPIVPRPRQASADAHAFAVYICDLFEYAYGAPCIEAATALVSEVFDTLIDTDTVKKWWQRRAGDDDQGDTSEELP